LVVQPLPPADLRHRRPERLCPLAAVAGRPARCAARPGRRGAGREGVWLDEHFWAVNFKLAAGAGLRAASLSVAYEQTWDEVSPDWTVLSGSVEPLAFVEVLTDMPSRETFGQMRAWHGLVERIKAIPVPVVLQVASR